MKKNLFSNHHAVLWIIALLGFGLRVWNISGQPPLENEVEAAYSATAYMKDGLWSLVMWVHPQLRSVAIYLSGKVFGGYTAWGLRAASILTGSLSVLLLGYLAHALFKNRRVSYLSAFFLAIDPLLIAFSRQSFQECITSFFILAGVLAAYHGIKKENIYLCYFSGALFGLASASKWHGLFPWAVSAVAYVFAPRFVEKYEGIDNLPVRLFNAVTAFFVIPLMVYIAVFIPWLDRGQSLGEFFDFQLFLLKSNYIFRAAPYAETYLLHRAYFWFIWPTAWTDFVYYQGKPYLDIAMGNFLVWVLTLPSFFFALKRWLNDKAFELGFALALFFFSYLPLILTGRSLYVFSAPAVLPFAFILTAYLISQMLESGKLSKRTVIVYLVTISFVSALMYPLSTMRALEYSYLKPIAEQYSPHAREHSSK